MKKMITELIKIALDIVLIVAVFQLVTIHIGHSVTVSGASMNPTFEHGDFLVLEKLTKEYERGDVVVIYMKNENEPRYLIKRVIGLPGETIQIKNGVVYINGKILEESYCAEAVDIGNEGKAAELVTLADGEYFCLGDNRNNSIDSRSENIGNITREDIVGKVFVQLFPISDFKIIP